jgi:hypothetical protein
VQHLANGFAENGGHYYNDVARPFFDEAIFQIHVVVLTIGRFLPRLLWFVLETLWWSIWSTFDMIGETILHVCYVVGTLFIFGLQTLIRVSLVIPSILRDFPWHRLKQIALVVVPALAVYSFLHGFTKTTAYICDNPELIQEWTSMTESCNLTSTLDILKVENRELDKLVHANYAVVQSISNMSGIGRPNPHPGFGLTRETMALVQFAEEHSDGLATFSKNQDIVAVAKTVHKDVTAFNNAVEKFAHNHVIRLQELEIKMHHILADAKNYTPQTLYQRFFLESASFLLPSIFSYTSVGRQSSHLVGVTTHFLDSPQTTTILQQSNSITKHLNRAKQGINIVQEAIARYEPFWKNHCQQNGEAEISGHIDCGVVDPSDLNQRLQKALKETEVAASKLRELRRLHRIVKGAMTVLRGDLVRLLKIAAEHKSVAGNKSAGIDAASARASLHQFVVEVGAVDIMIGYGTYDLGMGLGTGVAKGSKFKSRLEDGTLVTHLEKYVS